MPITAAAAGDDVYVDKQGAGAGEARGGAAPTVDTVLVL